MRRLISGPMIRPGGTGTPESTSSSACKPTFCMMEQVRKATGRPLEVSVVDSICGNGKTAGRQKGRTRLPGRIGVQSLSEGTSFFLGSVGSVGEFGVFGSSLMRVCVGAARYYVRVS